MTELDFTINVKSDLSELEKEAQIQIYDTDGVGFGVIVSTNRNLKDIDRIILSVMNLTLNNEDVHIEGYGIDVNESVYSEFVFSRGFSEYALFALPRKGSKSNDFEGAVKPYLMTIDWFND